LRLAAGGHRAYIGLAITKGKRMTDEAAEIPNAAPGKALTAAARRALEEAALRHQAQAEAARAAEAGGPAGPEPTRFGDWERKGMAIDF